MPIYCHYYLLNLLLALQSISATDVAPSFRLHNKQTTRAVGHVLPGVAMGTAVTLDLHGPWRGDVQSSSLGGRETTRHVQPQCPGNSLSPSLRQQGELWWCPLAVLWGNRVGQWCFRDRIPSTCLKSSPSPLPYSVQRVGITSSISLMF